MEPERERAVERFEQLFERHHAQIAAYVRRRGGPDAVEDAVAETFLLAWRSLDRLDGDPLPWLYGVARRVLANEHRGRRRRGALGDRLAGQPAAQPPEPLAAEVSEPLRGALLALGPKEREAVLLIAWEGLTPEQAARASGCSAAAFRGRLHRARRRLARELGGDGLPLTQEASET
jgi:RNA polymerase sigma-70 factor (ECF subfamily)